MPQLNTITLLIVLRLSMKIIFLVKLISVDAEVNNILIGTINRINI